MGNTVSASMVDSHYKGVDYDRRKTESCLDMSRDQHESLIMSGDDDAEEVKDSFSQL